MEPACSILPFMVCRCTYPNHSQQLALGRRRVRHAPCQHKLFLHATVAQSTAPIVNCSRGRVFDSHCGGR